MTLHIVYSFHYEFVLYTRTHTTLKHELSRTTEHNGMNLNVYTVIDATIIVMITC